MENRIFSLKDAGNVSAVSTVPVSPQLMLRSMQRRQPPPGLSKEFTAEMYYQCLRELRSSLENPQTPLSYPAEWLLDIFNGGRTDAGIRVSQLTALQVPTVWSCVDLISGSVASLPLHVYERLLTKDSKPTHKGSRIAYEQPIF